MIFFMILILFIIIEKNFTYYHSLLDLDDTHLKSKYKEILLAAIVMNINDQLFSFAYDIINIKNDDN